MNDFVCANHMVYTVFAIAETQIVSLCNIIHRQILVENLVKFIVKLFS